MKKNYNFDESLDSEYYRFVEHMNKRLEEGVDDIELEALAERMEKLREAYKRERVAYAYDRHYKSNEPYFPSNQFMYLVLLSTVFYRFVFFHGHG